MKRITYGFWIVLAAAAMAMSACGSSKSGHINSGGARTTIPAAGGGTTACTIPQHNGGDHDADNNGGPSDGDGCDK